jgi:hypothetical protein
VTGRKPTGLFICDNAALSHGWRGRCMLIRPVIVDPILARMPGAEPSTLRRFPLRLLLAASVPCGRAGKSTVELDRPPTLSGLCVKDLHSLGLQKVPDNPLGGLTPKIPDLRVAFIHRLPPVCERASAKPPSCYRGTRKIYVHSSVNSHRLCGVLRLLSSWSGFAKVNPQPI